MLTHCKNALCSCQFRGKWGKNRGYRYWISTLNESVLSYQVADVCAKFHQNRLKSATVRARTDRHTNTHGHTHRDDRGDLIICPMLCYSNGTDKNKPLNIQGGSKKVSCYTLVDNFGKCGPISIILSLLVSQINCGIR